MYTRDEIMSMSAGRELDVIITTKVMELDQWYTYSEFLKPYSTSIAAAWEVIEKLQSDWSWDMQMISLSREVDVRIGNSYCSSTSVPYAICICALLTLIKED